MIRVGPSNGVDDAPQINAAATQWANSSETEVVLNGPYVIASTINFPLQTAKRLRIIGEGPIDGGTLITCKPNFSGIAGLDISATGSIIASWSLEGLMIRNQVAGQGASIGCAIGGASPGTLLEGLVQNSVKDMVVSGFAQNFQACNARLIEWERCAAWSGDASGNQTVGSAGWVITNAGAGGFSGDMDFRSCQAVAPYVAGQSASGDSFLLWSIGGAGAEISGIRFHGFQFYGGANQLAMVANPGCGISDISANTECQFEGPTGSTVALFMQANGAGSFIHNVRSDGSYMAGHGFMHHIQGSANAGAELDDLAFRDNYCVQGLPNYAFFDLRATGGSGSGLIVSGNKIVTSGGAVAPIYIENFSDSEANDNILRGSGPLHPNFVQFNGPSGDYIVGQGNNSGGRCSGLPVVNSGNAPHALITPNL